LGFKYLRFRQAVKRLGFLLATTVAQFKGPLSFDNDKMVRTRHLAHEVATRLVVTDALAYTFVMHSAIASLFHFLS
jgi:diaminopimelate decarboxylase